MNKFTNKRWRYSEIGNRVTQDDEKYLPIAEVYGCSLYLEEEYKTNGRLMASAPDMYRVIEKFIAEARVLINPIEFNGKVIGGDYQQWVSNDLLNEAKSLLKRIDGEKKND